MLDVGLTGGIASGKSAVATRLVELGAVLIDADAIARQVLEPDTDGLASVVEAFGQDLVDADGRLDRPRLGRIVFADPEARDRLNGIVHPRVRAEAARIRDDAAAEETADRPTVVVQDIPLLVETGQAASFDVVVTVQAPRAERIRRMVADRGMGEDDALARMAAQATDDERAAVSDVVLDNAGTVQQLRVAVDDLWTEKLVPLAAGRSLEHDRRGAGIRRKGTAATYRFGYGMKWVTWLFIATGVLWAAAIVLWLMAGGRGEFTTGAAPWSWQVLVPAWMTLTGIVLALGGCVVFAQQISAAILGRFEHDGLLDPPSRSGKRHRPSA